MEVHSKITEAIRVQRVYLRFNDPFLNFDVTGDFQLSKKGGPITINKELYISKESSFKDFTV